MARYKQTAQSYNSFSESASIINPIHPLYGQNLTVSQIRHLGKQTRIIFSHPDGGLISVPVSETSLELPQPSPQVGGVTPLFDPRKLMRLAELVSTSGDAATSITSSFPEHEEVVDGKNDAKTASKPLGRSRRHRRTKSTINQSDSSIGKQNPRPEGDGANPRQGGN